MQLLLAGYMLTYIFAAQSSWIVLAVLAVMVLASGQIALNTIKDMRWMLYKKAALSLLVGGGFPLLVISQGVLSLESWYAPQYIVPLGVGLCQRHDQCQLGGGKTTRRDEPRAQLC